MKTKQYVDEFHLDNPNYRFNRKEFMRVFSEEFNQRVEATMDACKRMDVKFSYEKFQHIIKEQQDKFWNISNKKAGEPLTEGLFSAFFAIHVVPLRAKLFPEVHEKIEKLRAEQALKEQEKHSKDLDDDGGNY